MRETADKTFSEFVQDMKEEVSLFLFNRRYQKTMEGKTPWEEIVWTNATKFRTELMVRWRSLVKRSVDLTAATFGLIVSAPIMALAAVAIEFDSPGPVLFGQVRVG